MTLRRFAVYWIITFVVLFFLVSVYSYANMFTNELRPLSSYEFDILADAIIELWIMHSLTTIILIFMFPLMFGFILLVIGLIIGPSQSRKQAQRDDYEEQVRRLNEQMDELNRRLANDKPDAT